MIGSSDLSEGAIVIVVKKLRRMWVLRVRLVAHIEVKPAIAVEVRPCRGLPGMERQQPGALSYVFKRAVAEVMQQRHGILAVFTPPAPTQYQQIRTTVVIVVGGYDVQTAGFAGQARVARPIGEPSVPVVVKTK
jgi:hypothetical protein